jgi:hypothetical protein
MGSLLLGTLMTGNVKACEYNQPIPPSRTSRIFQNTSIGFSFEFPENYRAMGVDGGAGILIVDPSTYAHIQCQSQSEYGGDAPQFSALIGIHQVSPGRQQSLYDLVIQNYPYMRNEGENFRNANFSGNLALVYSQDDLLYDTTINYVSLLSKNGRYLITISGHSESRELTQILNSFRLQ